MIRHWDLFRELNQIRREFDRVFNENGPRLPFSRVSFLPGRGARQYPLINIRDDKESIYVEALAPGVDADSLDISAVNSTLTISGEKKAACEDVSNEAYHRCERASGKFIRTIELTTPFDADRIAAEYKNGLLLITLPKVEAAKPKRIAITAG